MACGQVIRPSLRRVKEGRAIGGEGRWTQGRWGPWACGFGLLVPLAVLVVERLCQKHWAAEPALAQQTKSWLGVGLFLVMLALLAGAAGWRTRAWRTAAWAGLAVAANGLVLAAWATGQLFKMP